MHPLWRAAPRECWMLPALSCRVRRTQALDLVRSRIVVGSADADRGSRPKDAGTRGERDQSRSGELPHSHLCDRCRPRPDVRRRWHGSRVLAGEERGEPESDGGRADRRADRSRRVRLRGPLRPGGRRARGDKSCRGPHGRLAPVGPCRFLPDRTRRRGRHHRRSAVGSRTDLFHHPGRLSLVLVACRDAGSRSRTACRARGADSCVVSRPGAMVVRVRRIRAGGVVHRALDGRRDRHRCRGRPRLFDERSRCRAARFGVRRARPCPDHRLVRLGHVSRSPTPQGRFLASDRRLGI